MQVFLLMDLWENKAYSKVPTMQKGYQYFRDFNSIIPRSINDEEYL